VRFTFAGKYAANKSVAQSSRFYMLPTRQYDYFYPNGGFPLGHVRQLKVAIASIAAKASSSFSMKFRLFRLS
jgi:hypothetical protein